MLIVVGIVDPDGQHILRSVVQILAEVIFKIDETVGAEAQMVAVDIDVTAAVDAVKEYLDGLSPVGSGDGKSFAVVACSPGEIGYAAAEFVVKRQRDAPVVRQADLLPEGIVKSGLSPGGARISACRAEVEFPIPVEIFLLTGKSLLRNRHQAGAEQDKGKQSFSVHY